LRFTRTPNVVIAIINAAANTLQPSPPRHLQRQLHARLRRQQLEKNRVSRTAFIGKSKKKPAQLAGGWTQNPPDKISRLV
jgi:hypothetical protein